MYFRKDKVGLTFKLYLLFLMVSTVFALIGARLIFVIAMLPQIEININSILGYLINGGIVFYGGMLGSLLGVAVSAKIWKMKSNEIMDMAAPAIPLFHFWARLGCLFAGCCYGIPWHWGVVMQDSPTVIRFPVQFFESVCNLVIFIYILWVERRHGTYEGNLRRYLLSYAICRFLLEFFRGDTVRGIWPIGLSTAQIISLLIVLVIISKSLFYRKYKTDNVLQKETS